MPLGASVSPCSHSLNCHPRSAFACARRARSRRAFSAALAEYRRARLLAHYVRGRARHRDLYLSFVNFAVYGDEGDVCGNALAVLCGLADDAAAFLIACDALGGNRLFRRRLSSRPGGSPPP